MRFELSDEQLLLQQTAAELAKTHYGAAAAPKSVNADWQTGWQAITELGLGAILIPEEDGGSGGSLLDACIVAEQLGAASAWAPFLGCSIAAVSLLRDTAVRPVGALEQIASGAVFSVLVDGRLDWPGAAAASPQLAFDWRPGSMGLRSSGDDRLTVEALEIESVDDTDLLHPLARIASADRTADNTSVRGAAATPPTPAPLTAQSRAARAAIWVGAAAWLAGIAADALTEAVAYAKIRRQFGVPIGSFQAIQHLCAQMLVDVETSRSAMLGAAWTVDNRPLAEGELAAAAAKSWCARAARQVCETGIQVLGGIGVTWEHPAHLRLRTAHQFGRVFGAPRQLHTFVAQQRISTEESSDGSV